ncbi:NUDIX hydrolase [Planctomonas psychrotolerans]|uniref:NUDIX hydrolase n=1 Tax=Planctomonas psychrotolerans TaxID=2528712 RepID=UPI00123AB74C|nr:NUDIX hydrolase [Planctomonas psychrotolerans]
MTPTRDPGDAWVEGPNGSRFWGRFGAAGLLLHDPARGILLQHRVEWSHFGGTWGIPGGAIQAGERPVDGAMREAAEEAGVPLDSIEPRFTHVLDLGFWSYTTLIASIRRSFEPVISDPESLELRWVPVDEVDALPLHPGFGAAWPTLRRDLDRHIHVVVDAANVVGSRPDGWWRDRRGAAERLLAEVVALASAGLPAYELELPHATWWPSFTVVVEGQAGGAALPGDAARTIRVVSAPASGDDAIVAEVETLLSSADAADIHVVTSDRGLRDRVTAFGAQVHSTTWLRNHLDRPGSEPGDGV